MHKSIAALVEPFLAEVDGVLGAGYTAVLFGSAARGDHVPGRSDVNLMLIVERADPAELMRLRPAFLRWRRRMPVPPLVISRQEWLDGVDVFPIEICDMQSAREVLRGPDLVAEARAAPTDLRRALEKEFRGKLLRLRQRYLAHGEGKLGEWAGASISAIVLFFRCLLVLAGRPAPADPRATVDSAAALVGFDAAPVLRVLACRTAPSRVAAADFEAYLDAVATAARFTDQLDLGGQPS